jgi:hypothetical protein
MKIQGTEKMEGPPPRRDFPFFLLVGFAVNSTPFSTHFRQIRIMVEHIERTVRTKRFLLLAKVFSHSHQYRMKLIKQFYLRRKIFLKEFLDCMIIRIRFDEKMAK